VAGSVTTAAAVTATRIQALSSSYVDGASFTLVRGQVSAVDASLGRLSVCKLLIDYTPSLGNPDAAVPAVGEFAELSGVQPSPNGVMLAYSSKSIVGSDIQGKSIVGSDIQGASIIGSDIQGKSIVGSDIQGKSIVGSDIQGKSIVGSDIQGTSIIGSDIQGKSIVGSDAQ
jgi:hypothetical protein